MKNIDWDNITFVIELDQEKNIQKHADKLNLFFNKEPEPYNFMTSGWRKWVYVDKNKQASLVNTAPVWFLRGDQRPPIYKSSQFIACMIESESPKLPLEYMLVGCENGWNIILNKRKQNEK